MEIIDGITMMDMGKTSPVRSWLKYKDVAMILDRSGIYAIKLCNEIVYVGQSCNLFARLLEHCTALFSDKPSTELKYKLMRNFYKDMSWEVLEYQDCDMLIEAENYYIDKYNPIFNIQTPHGEQYFWGTQEDIEDFCCGLLTMDDLHSMVKEKKKTAKETKLVKIESILDNTIQMPKHLEDGLKNHTLHGNAINEILKAIEFKKNEEKRKGEPCSMIIEIKDNKLVATSYLKNGVETGRYIGRKRRIWEWKSKKIT